MKVNEVHRLTHENLRTSVGRSYHDSMRACWTGEDCVMMEKTPHLGQATDTKTKCLCTSSLGGALTGRAQPNNPLKVAVWVLLHGSVH
jgi:hypothetical protein